MGDHFVEVVEEEVFGIMPREEECEDFWSHIHLKPIKNDYAVFRRFQRRNSLRKYP